MVSTVRNRPGGTSEVTPLIDTPSTRWSWSRRALAAGVASVALVSAGSLAVHLRENADTGDSFVWPHIWYMHIPKTSTGFMLEVAYAVCPELPRPDLTSPDCIYKPDACVFAQPEYEACAAKFAHMKMGHESPQDVDFDGGAPFVGMFRDPTSRVAAGFVHAFHDCGTMAAMYGCDEHSETLCPGVEIVTDEKVTAYFNCVKGCQARMLTGRACHDDGDGPVDVAKAVTRVQNNFIYAGITGRFEQSVRDFHRIIGAPGEVPPEAFERSNPQRGGDRGQAIEEQVAAAIRRLGLRDLDDEEVYAAATKKNDDEHAKMLGLQRETVGDAARGAAKTGTGSVRGATRVVRSTQA